MCHRCDWPYKLVIDEDKPEESYTSDFRRPGDRNIFIIPERTWVKKEES